MCEDRAMNFPAEDIWKNLMRHRVQIVQELRVDRALLFDYLRSKEVFDSEDCEIIQAEKTSERKASKLLDILETKSTQGLQHFLDVLQLLNPGLYEKLTGHKATARVSPISINVSDKSLEDIDQLRDLNILSNQLKRTVADLQEMIINIRNDHLLKEQYVALWTKLLSKEEEAKELKERNEELMNKLKELSKNSLRVPRQPLRTVGRLPTKRNSDVLRVEDEAVRSEHGSYMIDDSITPVRRPRAYDLDRSKTPRRLFYNRSV